MSMRSIPFRQKLALKVCYTQIMHRNEHPQQLGGPLSM